MRNDLKKQKADVVSMFHLWKIKQKHYLTGEHTNKKDSYSTHYMKRCISSFSHSCKDIPEAG